ncbi:MAG: DNA repair protein RadC, partial [Patescibacteria group bacterium]|nr:DNA repair protein RadC [Patescibacteria group bacterium]
LAILLGSGIKGKNVQKLSQQIIKKFGKDFLNITVSDLLKISGIGQAKALQIASAVSLVKRFYEEKKQNEIIIKNPKDVFSLVCDLQDKKKEYLVCLYLNARNVLIKKETISVDLLDKSLLRPKEIFKPAIELNAAKVILVHNHPSGDPTPSEKDIKIIEKIVKEGELMGVFIADFLIVAKHGNYSFYKNLKKRDKNTDYIADGIQGGLFDLLVEKKEEYGKNNYTKLKKFINKCHYAKTYT